MSQSSLLEPKIFGKYALLKKLAAGGMAEVFLARPNSLDANGRILIIKKILPHIAEDPVFLQMFRAEIHVIMGFNHPNTVQLYDFGEVDQQLYIAMEYIEGKSLKQLALQATACGEELPIPTVLSVVAQAASGLAYAHGFENRMTGEVFNTVHRDVSPHNLILSYDGNLKVIDFGVAKASTECSEATRTGTIKGKVSYMSPEQINGEVLDGRSDIFSLGIVAWELLTSQRLFFRPGEPEGRTVDRIGHSEKHVVPPSVAGRKLPVEIDNAILKALCGDRDKRYATAHDFQRTLRNLMQKFYPDYAYADTGKIVQRLFAKEMVIERKELRDINDKAQSTLAVLHSVHDSKTNLISSTPGTPAENGVLIEALRLIKPHFEVMERALKQKAKPKHYAWIAFYVASILLIKLDDHYSLLARFTIPTETVNQVTASRSIKTTRLPAGQAQTISKVSSKVRARKGSRVQ